MMKRGAYKLAKAEGGICHYADIEIELVEGGGGCTEIEIPSQNIDSRWVSAAKQGVEVALASLETDCFKLGRIIKLEGTLADTTSDSVWLSAVLATVDAMKASNQVRDVSLQEGTWIVEIGNTKLTFGTT